MDSALTGSAVQEIRSLTHPGELAYFLNTDPGHFLVDWLAGGADLRTYNAGSAKSITRGKWFAAIRLRAPS